MTFESIYRRAVLGVAGTPPIERFLRQRGMRLGVSRFVAGVTVEEALETARSIEESGLLVILDLLGEFVDTAEGAGAMTEQIQDAVRRTGDGLRDPSLSIKPTQIGLGVDFDLALDNARSIARCAGGAGTSVCLDMESHEYVDGTLELFRRLVEDGYGNVSTVLQSYLHRTEADLESLLRMEPKPELRLVKGAYREPASVAFQNKAKVDDQYGKLVRQAIDGGAKTNIATHDERLLTDAGSYLQSAKVGPDDYEFQLLFGVKPGLQRRLQDAGHPVRIYTPFGEDWYGYFSRRLAERPANAMFVLRGLFG